MCRRFSVLVRLVRRGPDEGDEAAGAEVLPGIARLLVADAVEADQPLAVTVVATVAAAADRDHQPSAVHDAVEQRPRRRPGRGRGDGDGVEGTVPRGAEAAIADEDRDVDAQPREPVLRRRSEARDAFDADHLGTA